MRVVIIGGVAGGMTTATRLRRLDETSEIIVLERGEYVSYANCGLPYYIGDEIKEKSDLILYTPEYFKKRFNIDVRVSNEVISIDRSKKQVSIKTLNDNLVYNESYDTLVISTGAEAIKPDIVGMDIKQVFTIRDIQDTYKIKEYIDYNKPKSVVIAGGGYIGIEMAENLFKIGLDVTIVEISDHIISSIDYDMSSFVKSYLRKKGIKILLSNGIYKVEEGTDKLVVTIDDDFIETDMVIMSVGVKPDSKLAKESDLDLNSRGGVIVNEYMQTSDANIYALGDVVEITNYVTKEKGYIPLAGPANKQARVVANNICGNESKYNGTQGSSIIKIFDMTVASTGINEDMAKKLNIDYDKVFINSYSHATYYPKSLPMIIKVIFGKITGKILGVQIVGYDGVDKRCDVFATAIRANMTAKDLIELELCYSPPYSSVRDPVNLAGSVIENTIEDNVRNVHYEDVRDSLDAKNYVFLDVRTNEEYKRGSIGKSVNIPLDELRDRIDEVDKTKKIIVFCHSGLRSYIAYKILENNNYECYNLAGGYLVYNSIINSIENK